MRREIGIVRGLLVGLLGAGTLASRAVAQGGDERDLVLDVIVDARAAQDAKAQPRDVSDLLTPILKKHKVPALAAVLIDGDRIVMQGCAGVRAVGSTEPVTMKDLWHLGSCTKSMTATLAATMVEKGIVSWDTTLEKAFPDLKDRMHEEFRSATMAQLCTNRAGVPGELHQGDLWGKLWDARGTPTEQRRMLLEGVVTRKPFYPPGTKNVYSNGGFAIAGHMLETIAKKPYEELMQEHLFGPLGMTSVGWGAPGSATVLDQPRGHSKDNKPVDPQPDSPSGVGADNPIAISPAGRLHCTITDWSKYIAMHLRGDRHNPNRRENILHAASFERLHTPPDGLTDYAYGWSRPQRPWAGPEGNRFVLTHNGSNTMWFCVTWIAPASDFAVLVCCNKGEKGDAATDEATWALIQEHLKTIREREKTVPPEPASPAPAPTPGP